MSNIILENQLYADATARAALVADKKLCMDALLINFFGFLGLFKLSDSRGPMKNYETTEGKLMLNNIGDTNHDVSLSVKLAYEAGLLTMPAVNAMTKLLVLIKNKTVKGATLNEKNIRDILDMILYKSHQPSAVVMNDVIRFHTGIIGIGELSKEFYTLVRTNKHLQPVTVEFRNLVMKGQYGDFFTKMGKVLAAAPPAANIINPQPAAATPAPKIPAFPQHPPITTVPVTAPTAPATISHAPITPAATPPAPVRSGPAPTIKVLQYVNTTAGHNKFWAGGVYGDTLYTVWGPIGKTPQKSHKVFPDAASAQAALALLKREKINKGYHANANMTLTADNSVAAPAAAPLGAASLAAAIAPAATPAPKPVAPPPIQQGTTNEFFKNLIAHARDGANMNTTFKTHGVAKSTFNLKVFYQWLQVHILSNEDWHQKDPKEEYESLPLVKHIKTLSGYKDVNNCLASAWAINSIKRALVKHDADWFLNVMNASEFYKIIQGDTFGTGLAFGSSTGWGARNKLKTDYAQLIARLMLSHISQKSRDARSVADLEKVVVDLRRWQTLNRNFGNGLFVVSPSNNTMVTWEEDGVTGAMLKVYVAAQYFSGPNSINPTINFVIRGNSDALILNLKKEVRTALQGQVMLIPGTRIGFSGMTISSTVLKSLDPGVQDAIKLLRQMPTDAVKNFFNVVEGDNIEATMKELTDASNVKAIFDTVENSGYSSWMGDIELGKLFNVDEAELDRFSNLLYKHTNWVGMLFMKLGNDSRRERLYEWFENKNDKGLHNFATVVIKTLMKASEEKHRDLGPESDRNQSLILALKSVINKKYIPNWQDCVKTIKDSLDRSPELVGKIIALGHIEYATYGSSSTALNSIRVWIGDNYPEFIVNHPEGIGAFLTSEAKIPDTVKFSSAQQFRDTMSILYNVGLTSRIIDARFNDVKHIARVIKDGLIIHGIPFAEKYPLGGGPAGHSSALAGIYFMAALLENEAQASTKFVEAAKVNRDSVSPGQTQLSGLLRMLLNGMNGYLQTKMVEENKPMVRGLFELASANKGSLNNASALYLKTLTKEEIVTQLSNGELKKVVLAGRATQHVLDGLAENTIALADTAPKATIGMFELVEELFKDKRTYDKSMRDSLTSKMSAHLFDIHRTNPKVANTIFMAVKGELKRSLLDRATGEALIKTLDTHLYGDASLVKPLQKITPERVKELLKYNSVSVDTIRLNSPAGKSITALEAEITKTASAMVAPKVTHTPGKLAAKDKTSYLERKSVEYAAFQNYRHGDIALRFLDEFDVDIAPQVKAYNKWVADHPGTETMKMVFHGTGSIAATFILRFGFAIVKAGDPSCTGRMLGDGIYFSNVLDKATQYIGDSGFSRKVGLKGYILECEAALGTKNVNYQSAGNGNDHIRSPEWCVREKSQLKINKAFLCEMISKQTMEDLQRKHRRGVNEGVIMKITTFKEFIKEAKTQGLQTVTYSFRDGFIPVSETEYKDFQDLEGVTFPPNVSLEPSAYGPMIIIDCEADESEGFVVANTSEFMQDPHELGKFLRLAFNK